MLIRDVAYGAMTKAERAENHQRFADWIGERAPDELVEIRAHHLDRAVALVAELDGAVPAGPRREPPRRSRRRGSVRFGATRSRAHARLFRRALELEPTPRPPLSSPRAPRGMLGELGDVAHRDGAVRAEAHARRATSSLEGRALAALAEVAMARDGDPEQAARLRNARRSRCCRRTRSTPRADALRRLGAAAWWPGDLRGAEAHTRQAIELAEEAERRDLWVRGATTLQWLLELRLELDAAEDVVLAASAHPAEGVLALRPRAARRSARCGASRDASTKPRRCSRRRGCSSSTPAPRPTPPGPAPARLDRSRRRRPPGAERAFREAVRVFAASEDHGRLCEAQRALAEVLLVNGQVEHAERQALAAHSLVSSHDLTSRSSTTTTLGLVRAAQGRDEEAETLLRESLALLDGNDYQLLEIAAIVGLARVPACARPLRGGRRARGAPPGAACAALARRRGREPGRPAPAARPGRTRLAPPTVERGVNPTPGRQRVPCRQRQPHRQPRRDTSRQIGGTMKPNITARAARWSAAHWKTATLGWLAFVAVAVVAGAVAGTKMLTDAETSTGETARAETILTRPDSSRRPSESVLVQSKTSGTSDAAFRRRSRRSSARLRARPEVKNVHRTQTSRDGRSTLVEFDLRGDASNAEDRVQPVLNAVSATPAGLARLHHRRVRRRERQSPGGRPDQQGPRARPSSCRCRSRSSILLLAFGAFVAAGVPVLLALSAVLAATGLDALVSHVSHTTGAAASVILLIGMAVGVDYSLFYVEARARGAPARARRRRARAGGGDVGHGGARLRRHRADRDGRHALLGLEDLHGARSRIDARRGDRRRRLADGAAGAARASSATGSSAVCVGVVAAIFHRLLRLVGIRSQAARACARPPHADQPGEGRPRDVAAVGSRPAARAASSVARPPLIATWALVVLASAGGCDAHEAAGPRRPAEEPPGGAGVREDRQDVPGLAGAGDGGRARCERRRSAVQQADRPATAPRARDRADERAGHVAVNPAHTVERIDLPLAGNGEDAASNEALSRRCAPTSCPATRRPSCPAWSTR